MSTTAHIPVNYHLQFVPLAAVRSRSTLWGVASWQHHALVFLTEEQDLIGLGFASPLFPPEVVIHALCAQLQCLPQKRDDQIAEELLDRLLHSQSTAETVTIKLYGTPFQHQVWQILNQIRPACTITYQDIAHTIGKPLATQAVGQAVSRNPIAWVIPCHRVLPVSGKLGGFRWGADIKTSLLAIERGR